MDRFLLFLIILLFIIFSVGCSAAPTAVRPSVTLDLPVATASFTAVKPSPTPTRVPVITATLAFARPTAPAINPSASPARTPQPVPSAPISENGPWFVYYHDGEKGLIAANPDGSGRTVLLKDLQSSWIQLAGSPDTHLLAVVTQWTDVPEHDPLNYALLLIRLPGGRDREGHSIAILSWHSQRAAGCYDVCALLERASLVSGWALPGIYGCYQWCIH